MFKNKTGQKIPDVNFKVINKGEWETINTIKEFENKKVIIHALPGAATPTCSTAHLPRYEELFSKFKANGVDAVYCLSVNDTFVMNAWKKELGVNSIVMLPDGNGEFSDKMGMLVDKSDLGFGKRSWRYSMLVNNNIIEQMFIEPFEEGDPFKVSDADTMLKYINENESLPEAVAIITREGCSFCANAKNLLNEKNIDFHEIKKESGLGSVALRAISGNRTYPQIFIEGKVIGGYNELIQYLNK